jgi:hypothetical protein
MLQFFSSERTAKTLSQFLLDEEETKKVLVQEKTATRLRTSARIERNTKTR